MKKQTLSTIIGLSEKESVIYQAILADGQLTQSDIAKATGYNRTSLYPYLKQLLLKDLISKSLKGKRLLYSANTPERLMKNATKAIGSLEAALPALLETYQTVSNKPTIALRDGAEGIYQATLKAVQEAHHLKAFSSPNNFLSVLSRKEAEKLIKIIETRNIKSTTLTSHDDENLDIVQTFPSPNIEWRAMPSGISYPVEFLFYNKTTVITSWRYRFAIEIESEDITRFVEQLFDYFWKNGKQP